MSTEPRKPYAEYEVWATCVSVCLLCLCLMGGWWGWSHNIRMSDEAKAKSEAIQSLTKSGHTPEEIERVLAKWHPPECGYKSSGDKRAELTLHLLKNSPQMSPADIEKLVARSYPEKQD